MALVLDVESAIASCIPIGCNQEFRTLGMELETSTVKELPCTVKPDDQLATALDWR